MQSQLTSNPLVATLSPATKTHWQSVAQCLTLAAGSRLINEGDPAEWFYVLGSGRVRVFHEDEGGNQITVKLLAGPACFGELECLNGVNHIEFVECETPCVLWRVPVSAFSAAVATEPELTRALLFDLARRFLTSAVHERSLALLDVPLRVAQHILCLVQHQSGRHGSERLFIPKAPTRKAWADTLGVSEKSVSRALRAWTLRGAIRVEGSGLRVLDLAALEQAVGDLPFDLVHTLDAGQ